MSSGRAGAAGRSWLFLGSINGSIAPHPGPRVNGATGLALLPCTWQGVGSGRVCGTGVPSVCVCDCEGCDVHVCPQRWPSQLGESRLDGVAAWGRVWCSAPAPGALQLLSLWGGGLCRASVSWAGCGMVWGVILCALGRWVPTSVPVFPAHSWPCCSFQAGGLRASAQLGWGGGKAGSLF